MGVGVQKVGYIIIKLSLSVETEGNFVTFEANPSHIMRKIIGYRKLMNVTEKADLQELKTVYRNLIKTWHPDKFQDEAEKEAADLKSRRIIEAYHFLVSISPETKALNIEEYTKTITTCGISSMEHKDETLKITFSDGNSYEYFGVPKAIYVKLVNAPSQARFARRHICNSFVYRSVNKLITPSA
jgi:curved DNA-binding protein CbpA